MEAFKQAMQAAGLEPPAEILADGILHRFTVPGDKPKSNNGFYVLHSDDPPAGQFGCWKRGITQNWCGKEYKTLTPEEKAHYAAKMEAMRRQRDEEREQLRAECRKWCASTWENAKEATNENPYLRRKGISSYGLKAFGDTLMIPLMDTAGAINGIQFISADGSKKFKTGTNKAGHFYKIGKPKDETVLICEGYATGASSHQATGHCVVIAYDAGNLKAVAEAIRSKYPGYTIILAADDDQATEGNPGLTKATEAAKAVCGKLAVPVFRDAATRGTDFNDLHLAEGLEAVRACIEAAVMPEPSPATGNQPEGRCWPGPLDLVELSRLEPKPPGFIIPDWLPCGYATLFAGHGGVGKSGLALILAVCIALGIPFFGIPVERRKVRYLSCEDREGVLHWRLSRICAFLGVQMADLAGWLDVLDLVGHEVILYQPARDHSPLTTAYRYLSAGMAEAKTQVLFVDGISDTYDGNENARAEVKAFVNSLLALIPPDSGAVILIGHVAKMAANSRTAEGYSGSTAWHNAVRARWYLYPESTISEDGGTDRTGDLVLELQKSNLGPIDRAMTFSWDDAACMFVGKEKACERHFDRNYRERQERDGIVAAFRSCPDYVPAASSGQRTAYHVLSAQPNFPDSLRSGMTSRKRFWRHIEALRGIGNVIEDSITRKSDRKKVRILKLDKDLQQCSNAKNDIPAPLHAAPLAAMQQCCGGYKGGVFAANRI